MATLLVLDAITVLVIIATIIIGVCSKRNKDNEKLMAARIAMSIICIVLGVTLSVVSVTAIVCSSANNQYDVLESRYEQLNETYSFYKTRRTSYTSGIDAWLKEMYDYNNTVSALKAEAKNPWTNIFVNKKRVENLKYIQFVDGNPVFE